MASFSRKMTRTSACHDYFCLYRKIPFLRSYPLVFSTTRLPWNHFSILSIRSYEAPTAACDYLQVKPLKQKLNWKVCLKNFATGIRLTVTILMRMLQGFVLHNTIYYFVQFLSASVPCKLTDCNSHSQSNSESNCLTSLAQSASSSSLLAESSCNSTHDLMAVDSGLCSIASDMDHEMQLLIEDSSSSSTYNSSENLLQLVADSAADSDDENWWRDDYEPLDAKTLAEYDILRSQADWIYICCSKRRKPSSHEPTSEYSRWEHVVKRVTFSSNAPAVYEIDRERGYSPNDYQDARKDEYLSRKFSFEADIQRISRQLEPVLTNNHRQQMQQYIHNCQLAANQAAPFS